MEKSTESSFGNLEKSTRFSVEDSKELLKHLSKIRKIVSKSDVIKKDLPVYYPGAGADIVYPLAMTDAKKFIFVDFVYVTQWESSNPLRFVAKEIETINGKIISEKDEGKLGEEGKKVIDFEFGGKTRQVILYAEDAAKFVPPETSDGVSFMVIKSPTPFARTEGSEPPNDIDTPENMAKLYQMISVGGFIHWDPTHVLDSENIGFRKILEGLPETKKRYHTFPLYQKISNVLTIEQLLIRDWKLWGEKLEELYP